MCPVDESFGQKVVERIDMVRPRIERRLDPTSALENIEGADRDIRIRIDFPKTGRDIHPFGIKESTFDEIVFVDQIENVRLKTLHPFHVDKEPEILFLEGREEFLEGGNRKAGSCPKFLDLCEIELIRPPGTVGRAVERLIMKKNGMTIPGRLNIDLDRPNTKVDRMLNRFDRVFIHNSSRAAMADQDGSISTKEVIHPNI